MLTFKDFIVQEARKKVKEPSWVEDHSSGYGELSRLRDFGRSKYVLDRPQLFVPKRRDPAKLRELETTRRLRDVSKELDKKKVTEETTPVLTSFRESPAGENKPEKAFWTSSAIKESDGYTSEWNKMVRNRFPSWQTDYGFLFEVSPSARVFDISNAEPFFWWAHEHGMLTVKELDYMKMDYHTDMVYRFPWDVLARYFDGAWYNGWSSDTFSYGWDVESTAWFNTSVLKYKGAVQLTTHSSRDDDDD